MQLEAVAQTVIQRAERQGSILRREICEELARASLAESDWKNVLNLARPSLRFQKGRYHYVSPAVGHLRTRVREKQQQQRKVQRAVGRFIRSYREDAEWGDRREHSRIPLVLPVKIFTQDSRELNFLSQDISLSGIRLLGNCSLLRQKVTLQIPLEERGAFLRLELCILWACQVGDGLIQQGGAFLDVATADPKKMQADKESLAALAAKRAKKTSDFAERRG
jgi:hypothetical protein